MAGEATEANYLDDYTAAAAFEAEGARVGLVTCLTCGAAMLLDERDEFAVLEVHSAWHERAGR